MRPLTESTHKSLLAINGRPLIEHIAGALPDEVDEFILVVGYFGDKIRDFFGSTLLGRPVTYVTQKEAKGTYHALSLAQHLIRPGERFFVLYGDDLHGARGIASCLAYPRALLVSVVDDSRPYGVIEVNEQGIITNIEEKPMRPKSNIVSTGPMLLDSNIFLFPPDADPKSGELVLASAVGRMLRTNPCVAVESTFWFPVTTPEHLKEAECILISQQTVDKVVVRRG